MKYIKKLVGERIYLSPRNVEDYEIYAKWLNDFETTDYIGSSSNIMTLQGEKKWLEENLNNEASFAIVTLKDDKMIGSISIEKIDHIRRCGTLGIFIGDKAMRGMGIGKEAICLILDYAFYYLNLHSVCLTVYSFNTRAIACYESCGFQKCGMRRESYFLNGKYYDTILMDILSNEFTNSYIKNKNIGGKKEG